MSDLLTLARPGDLWCWPDGRMAFLSAEDIAAGCVTVRYAGRAVTHYIRDGRMRNEPHILAIMAEEYGVADVQ